MSFSIEHGGRERDLYPETVKETEVGDWGGEEGDRR